MTIINPAWHQAHAYQVNTTVYEGPLDLLLQLIERAELDVTRLAIAQVTDQYLEYLRHMEIRAPEEVSAFLVIAARLVQIKSEALLPRPPVREPGEEDLGDALARQLIAYKRYRQIANLLSQRETSGLRTYLRLASPPKVEGVLDLSGINLVDLTNGAQEIFFLANQKKTLGSVVVAPRITIRDKIQHIASMLRRQSKTTFAKLVAGRRSRLDIVVTFLALLELIKRQLVFARQDDTFGEIALESAENWTYEEDMETEFGE
jgi:segregation and condensation protein A